MESFESDVRMRTIALYFRFFWAQLTSLDEDLKACFRLYILLCFFTSDLENII